MNHLNEPPESADAKLDQLLRAWADQYALDLEAGITEADSEIRILEAIISAVPRGTAETRSTSTPIPMRSAWGPLAACVASVILIAVSFTMSPTSKPISNSGTAVAQAAVESQVKLSELWNRTADVFGPQLNWLCDLDGELLLGVNSQTSTTLNEDRAFVLLTVRERNARSDEWSSIWTGRIVCPLGEAVDFVSDKTHSGGTIWLQSRPDGRLVASHWLNWGEHPEISGTVDLEVVSGETRVVAEQSSNGHSIQVVQQVWIPSSSQG